MFPDPKSEIDRSPSTDVNLNASQSEIECCSYFEKIRSDPDFAALLTNLLDGMKEPWLVDAVLNVTAAVLSRTPAAPTYLPLLQRLAMKEGDYSEQRKVWDVLVQYPLNDTSALADRLFQAKSPVLPVVLEAYAQRGLWSDALDQWAVWYAWKPAKEYGADITQDQYFEIKERSFSALTKAYAAGLSPQAGQSLKDILKNPSDWITAMKAASAVGSTGSKEFAEVLAETLNAEHPFLVKDRIRGALTRIDPDYKGEASIGLQIEMTQRDLQRLDLPDGDRQALAASLKALQQEFSARSAESPVPSWR